MPCFGNTITVVLLTSVLVWGCAASPPAGEKPSSGSHPVSEAIGFYQGPLNHLSAVRKGPCPMHPSCSSYARQAIDAHGALVGTMMAADRLMRCGRDELRTAPRVWMDGRWKYYDPLEDNDFWWFATPDIP